MSGFDAKAIAHKIEGLGSQVLHGDDAASVTMRDYVNHLALSPQQVTALGEQFDRDSHKLDKFPSASIVPDHLGGIDSISFKRSIFDSTTSVNEPGRLVVLMHGADALGALH